MSPLGYFRPSGTRPPHVRSAPRFGHPPAHVRFRAPEVRKAPRTGRGRSAGWTSGNHPSPTLPSISTELRSTCIPPIRLRPPDCLRLPIFSEFSCCCPADKACLHDHSDSLDREPHYSVLIANFFDFDAADGRPLFLDPRSNLVVETPPSAPKVPGGQSRESLQPDLAGPATSHRNQCRA
jgi:hypothetical protein